MLYRDHKGSLADSMQTVIEVNSKQDIIDHLNSWWNKLGYNIYSVIIEYYCYDDRIGWDTYIVRQQLEGETNYTVAGFTDGLVT